MNYYFFKHIDVNNDDILSIRLMADELEDSMRTNDHTMVIFLYKERYDSLTYSYRFCIDCNKYLIGSPYNMREVGYNAWKRYLRKICSKIIDKKNFSYKILVN